MNQFIVYYRVSTSKQGIAGYGMAAQRSAIESYLARQSGKVIGEFREVESGKKTRRPELDKAIALCRQTKATLLIAKLDRLARNTGFVINLRDSGVNFVALDMPDANKLTITIMAAMAEQERDWISERTKAGLAEAKRRNVKLGNPHPAYASAKGVAARKDLSLAYAGTMKPIVKDLQQGGITTLRELAACLNRRGYQTPYGNKFFPQSVKNLLAQCR